jgi:hypothetical protein
MMRLPSLAGVIAVSLLVAGCGHKSAAPAPAPRVPGAAPVWPAPADPLSLIVAAGLTPERKETLINHVHAHLDIYFNGTPVRVPAGVGINIHDRGVHVGTLPDGTKGYGGIDLCQKPCISPLHTHDDSGVLHTESASFVPNSLGEFFTEWGVALTQRCVGQYCRLASPHVYVDGKPFTGDPRTILLTDHKEIAIAIGTPPETIPAKAAVFGP